MKHPTPPIEIVLDRPRTVRFTMGTVRRILADKGEGFLSGQAEGSELDHFSYLLWRGLQHEDPALTQEQSDDLVGLEQLGEVKTAVLRALGQDLPEKQEEGAGGNPTRGRRLKATA